MPLAKADRWAFKNADYRRFKDGLSVCKRVSVYYPPIPLMLLHPRHFPASVIV